VFTSGKNTELIKRNQSGEPALTHGQINRVKLSRSMYMDSTDRPELRLWKVLWPVSILAGLTMLVRLMQYQYEMEKELAPDQDTWASPVYGLVATSALLFITFVYILSKITPDRMRKITLGVALAFIVPLLAASYIPGFEVYVSINVILAVPVTRGLRLPVLVPRGKKLITWFATILSFFAIPFLSSLFAIDGLKLFQSQVGNNLWVICLSGGMASAYAASLIGKGWREQAWRGAFYEFVLIQVLVSLSVRAILDSMLTSIS